MSDDITIPPPGYYKPRHSDAERATGTYRTAAIALAILAVGGVAAIAASVMHFKSGPVPVIEADSRPIRVRPDNPGGMQIAGANNEILSGGNDTRDSKLAPPSEAPNPSALRVPPPAPSPTPTASPTTSPATSPATSAGPIAAPAPAKPVPAVVPAALSPVPRPAPQGKATIQLAAVGSEAAARAEWQALQKRMPGLLTGHEPSISKAVLSGKTYWRLRTTGFADAAEAKTVCAKVRAKGAACAVAEF